MVLLLIQMILGLIWFGEGWVDMCMPVCSYFAGFWVFLNVVSYIKWI